MTAKLGKNARPIAVGLVAVLVAADAYNCGGELGGGKGKTADEQTASSAPDERDNEISRLQEENAQKDQRIGEYESRISGA